VDSKPIVTLPNDLIERSKEFARETVAAYRRGDNSYSFDVSSHGAEFNAELQAHARMAECAFCLWAGLDANVALNWTSRCDPGWDVYYAGRRVDIKATHARGRYLIWPINKRVELFQKKTFDDLVLVRGDEPTFVIAGISSKQEFENAFQIAGRDHVLDAGTWYVHESDLRDVPERTPEQRLLDGLMIASMSECHLAEWSRRKR